MAESEYVAKDEGISDILEAADKYERDPGNDSDNDSKQQPYQDSTPCIENGEKALPEQNDMELHETEAIPTEKVSVHQPTVNKPDSMPPPESGFNGELDLADPESVIHMLETVDLTEEDTEGLLQEAYNMNRKLKEMLRRQEIGSSAASSTSSKSKTKSKKKSNPHHKNGHEGSLSSNQSSEANSRVGSSFGARKILPPISGENEPSVYAIKLKRSHSNMPEMRTTVSEPAVPRSKSTKAVPRKDSESPTRRRKGNSEPRPQWNDRFNYS